jgi:hypothetical protein
MLDAAGPLERWVLSRTLWLVLAPPAIALVWLAALPRERSRWARTIAAAALGLSLALIAVDALALSQAAGAVLFDPVARGARIGPLMADSSLRFDAMTAGASALATLVALVTTVFVRDRGAVAWILLALLGGLLAFLADDLVLVAMGWSLAAVALAWSAGRQGSSAVAGTAVRGAAGIAALVVGAALAYGGLGSWDELPYREAPPSFEILSLPGAREAGLSGPSLTMKSPAGATVFVDDARIPLARAPFENVALPSGAHVLRVRTGPASQDALVDETSSGAGDAMVLAPTRYGLSLEAPVVDSDRAGWSPALVRAVIVAWLVAALAMSARPPPVGSHVEGAVAAATSSLAGPYLLVRSFQVLAPPRDCSILVMVAGCLLFAAAVRGAMAFDDHRRWTSFAATAPAALTTLALGSGGAVEAAQVMLAGALVAAAVHLYVARRRGTHEPATLSAESLFVELPGRMGALVATMDRWVIGSWVDGAAWGGRAFGWVLAWQDEHAMARPADSAARRLAGVARSVEPLVGAPMGRVTWGLLLLAAACLVARSLWPGVP